MNCHYTNREVALCERAMPQVPGEADEDEGLLSTHTLKHTQKSAL